MTPGSARQPLVMLSGMLGDHTVWDEVAAELADICEPSFPRIDQDDTIEAMARSVLAEAPERFALTGHSLGGIVALEIIRQAPDRVSRLALLNTSARDASVAQLDSWSEMRSRTLAGDFLQVAAQLGEATLPEVRRDPDLVARNTAMATTVTADGFVRQLAAQAARPDSRPMLQRIKIPTVVITGGLDQVSPAPLQLELATGIPESSHVVIDGAGHLSPLEAPQAVAAALRAWLAD